MVTITLRKHEVDFILSMANGAELGGRSEVRPDKDDRLDKLEQDQIAGQLGEGALHKYWHGHFLEYARFRWFKNKVKTSGDKGVDIVPFNVDVKTSMISNGQRALGDYHLAVRDRERHDNWIYIAGLAKRLETGEAIVYLMGWATDSELPEQVDEAGPLKGAHTLPCSALHPMMPLRTLWRE